MRRLSWVLSSSLIAALGCGDDGGASDTDAADDTGSTSSVDPSTTGEPATTAPQTSEGSGTTSGEESSSSGGPSATLFEVTIENISEPSGVFGAGAFAVPDGGDAPAPAFPGESYTVEFGAAPGHYLSFATMFVQSNDFFIAPEPTGIALFDEAGVPLTGDITDRLLLWDAGTEEDEEPGNGPNQAPRQDGANTGDVDDDTAIRLASAEFPDLPEMSALVDASLSYDGEGVFTLTIENASTPTTLEFDGGTAAVPLSPGAFAVHTAEVAFFETGGAATAGMEALAEDGNPEVLAGELEPLVGLAVPLAPGVFVVHDADGPYFTTDENDRGEGLEGLAEDGDPSLLADALAAAFEVSGAFNTPVDAREPGPLFPGGAYTFQFEAAPGSRVSFATMFVHSNDLFYAPDEAGIALFDDEGAPVSGDITDQLSLWDAGTEDNQWPGAGPDQAPRQAGPNTGGGRSAGVTIVDDGFSYPANESVIRVQISAVK